MRVRGGKEAHRLWLPVLCLGLQHDGGRLHLLHGVPPLHEGGGHEEGRVLDNSSVKHYFAQPFAFYHLNAFSSLITF